MRIFYRLSTLGLVLLSLSTMQSTWANVRSSETLSARKGLFRLLSADVNEASDYHFRTSIEYFQQKGLLDDVNNSTVKRTRASIGFGYALTPNIHLSAHSGIWVGASIPQAAGTTGAASQSVDLVKSGFAITGTHEIGSWLGMEKDRLYGGASIWVDFSKITRFFAGPNIVPTLMLTSDWSDNEVVPLRMHINAGFRMANGTRYFTKSTAVSDFDRLMTDTINNWAYTTAIGFEFPVEGIVNPSVEIHMEKESKVGFANAPKWLTAGLKGRPFPQKNVELFAAADIGLSSFSATTLSTTGPKPEVGAVPLWNVVVGFGINQFGKRSGEVGISQTELEKLQDTLKKQQTVLSGLQKDLEYNTVQGRILDAETKQALGQVTISFPEAADIKPSPTDDTGAFIRYFRRLAGDRIVFSKEGYESSSKFLALRPGERISLDVELKKETGATAADFVATITDLNGQGLEANLLLKNTNGSAEMIKGSSDANGQLTLRAPLGTYDVIVSAAGYKSTQDRIVLEKEKTVIRTYTLTRSQ